MMYFLLTRVPGDEENNLRYRNRISHDWKRVGALALGIGSDLKTYVNILSSFIPIIVSGIIYLKMKQ